MSILYVARKKVFRVAGKLKSLYYIVPRVLQRKGVTQLEIGERIAMKSSLSVGDVVSTLIQLPKEIADELKMGRTVTFEGLGTFYVAVSSEGAETPEECTPRTIRSHRVCFRADEKLKKYMADCKFERLP